MIEQKLRGKVGDKKQEEAFPVPVKTPPSYLELIGNHVSGGKMVPRDRIELSTPAFSGPEESEQDQIDKLKVQCKK